MFGGVDMRGAGPPAPGARGLFIQTPNPGQLSAGQLVRRVVMMVTMITSRWQLKNLKTLEYVKTMVDHMMAGK